jgi:hypothetical protein
LGDDYGEEWKMDIEVIVEAGRLSSSSRTAKATAIFKDQFGSVVHRLEVATKISASPTDSPEILKNRALGQAKALAKEFSET